MFVIKKYFSLILLSFTGALAQDNDTEGNLFLSLAPLALIDIYDGASARIGAEYKINKNFGVTIDAGTYMKYLHATKINPEGFLITNGIKYYPGKKKNKLRYFGLEYMHKQQSYGFLDKLIINETGFSKQYGMKRKINSIAFKYGKMVNYGSKFFVEWYCGLGVRLIDSRADLTPEERDLVSNAESDCTLQENLIRQTGNRLYPDFLLGIKLGYKIL